ncbi:MAG: cyclic nucleotide-binding domain-containing protein [Elusimicrobiota bacterium]|jgi:CRP/FNR family transcriptional regulator|nr:cyclic nucleotide-binding domain-containing protein [Elusimicrobiota bacterium]
MFKKLFKFLFIDANLKDDVKFLKSIPLFQGVSDRALTKIALLVFKKTVFAGEQIFHLGQDAQVIYIVKKGSIQLSGGSKEKTISAGACFGKISFIKNTKHNANAKAIENGELYLIYRVKFEDLSESDGKTAFKIINNLLNISVKQFDDLEA